MKEKPIIFSTEMVKAILDGRKTQTRRVVKPQPILTYGLCGDTIYVYHNKGRCTYERNCVGEWCCVEGNTGISERGLYGRFGWAGLLPDEILRLWEKGIRGLVSLSRPYKQQGVSNNFDESQQQEGNKNSSSTNMFSVSRCSGTKNSTSQTFGREQEEQFSDQFSMGNSRGELAGSEGSWNGNSWGDPLGLEVCRRGTGTHQMGDRKGIMQSAPRRKDVRRISAYNLQHCPYEIGLKLWVRETRAIKEGNSRYLYKADGDLYKPWHPSIFMPREAARLFLAVKSVRVERLKDITRDDAVAEGITEYLSQFNPNLTEDDADVWRNRTTVENFTTVWDSINAKRGYGWDSNPLVWVVEFEVRP